MSTWKIICGDALRVLAKMPDASVNCVVTSQPYWGLRDYQLRPSVWGGDTRCRHRWVAHVQPAANGLVNGAMQGKTLSQRSATRQPRRSNFCGLCGAWRGQLGLEPTPQLYVAHLVAIFNEVYRVLADDGTLWLNLGDSHASGKGTCFNPGGGATSYKDARKEARAVPLDRLNKSGLDVAGLKSKDLVGVPWMVAFALRDAGWYLRSDIIWHKPAPMPESVRDRPTRSHEYLFLLSKSKRYYYDNAAIAEPCVSGPSDLRKMIEEKQRIGGKHKHLLCRYAKASRLTKIGRNRAVGGPFTRNRRSVWTIPTEPFRDAHFATFPSRLVEPCILAGSRPGDLVCDPFAGAATVGVVSGRTGRRFLGVEPNAEYCAIARKRLRAAEREARKAVAA